MKGKRRPGAGGTFRGSRSAAAEITVRRAVPGDEGVLTAIAAVVQELHFGARPDVFKAVAIPELEGWFRDALVRSDVHVAIADVAGKAVGYAVTTDGARQENAFAYPRRWRELDQLAVLPAHRRRGVARALVESVIAAAHADGLTVVELTAWSFNAPAQRAFRRLGFVGRNLRYELRR